MPQINDIRELAQQNAGYVSNSPQDWMSYLDVAARLYRYSFTDTLLIHAQRPDATACAELELWNQKMSRWVNRGAKGIALLDDTGPRTKLRYVFDIADTHLVRGGRTPLLWNLDSHEHEQAILDHLEDTYGLSLTDSMNTALMELAQQLTADNLDEAMDGLAYEVADKVSQMAKKREQLYADYVAGVVDSEDYQLIREDYSKQYDGLRAALQRAEAKKVEVEQQIREYLNMTSNLEEHLDDFGFDAQLVKSLVQRIEVSADKRIRIVFGFQDVFADLGKESAGK